MADVGVVCEFSGEVRDAFIRAGHQATSYDLLPSERPGPHIQCDVREADLSRHDILIFHPPCTDLAVSGAKHFHPQYDKTGNLISVGKIADGRQGAALEFVRWCMSHEQPWAVENPISVISSKIRKPDQIVNPWWFGHPETKATCLWLHRLPKLVPTNDVRAQMVGMTKAQTDRVHHAPPSEHRWKDRSRTFSGLAEAMASQWPQEVQP